MDERRVDARFVHLLQHVVLRVDGNLAMVRVGRRAAPPDMDLRIDDQHGDVLLAGPSRLTRADEADVRAAGVLRPHQHGVLARVPHAARGRRQAMVGHPARRGVHAARAVQRLERPGPAARSASAAGPGSAGCATVSPVGPRSNTAMSALITVPRWIFGIAMPSTRLYVSAAPRRRARRCRRDPRAARRSGGPRARAAPLLERREVLDEEDRQRVARRPARGSPAELLPARRPAPTVDGVAHVDAARAHRRDVGRQVVALHGDIAKAAARREEVQQAAPRGLAGAGTRRDRGGPAPRCSPPR